MQRNIDSKYRVPVVREVSHLKTNVSYTYRFCYVKIHCMLSYLYLYDLCNLNNKHLLFLMKTEFVDRALEPNFMYVPNSDKFWSLKVQVSSVSHT